MKISEIITDKYKLQIPPNVYYDLLADVREAEEEQEPCDDAISRQAVLELLKNTNNDWIINKIQKLPPVSSSEKPNTCEDDKPCTECPQYDHEKHNCPHFCHVIKSVIEENPIKTGHWRKDEIHSVTVDIYQCSVCDRLGQQYYRYCPHCGAKMLEMPTGSEGSDKQ